MIFDENVAGLSERMNGEGGSMPAPTPPPESGLNESLSSVSCLENFFFNICLRKVSIISLAFYHSPLSELCLNTFI